MKKTTLCITLALIAFILSACSSNQPTPIATTNTEIQTQYEQALQKIEDGQYDEAKNLLSGPSAENYLLSTVLFENMDKLEALLENKWLNSAYGWNYYSTFEITVSQDTITLYNCEDEYSGSEYMGDYRDRIDLEDLLEDGEADVSSSLRDNFTLDINNVLNGEITRYNEWVNAVYKIAQ